MSPDVRAILRDVSEHHDVPVSDIIGPRKYRHIVRARRDAMRRVSAAKPHFSTTQIARIFNRHHTTVLHHLGRITRRGGS